MEICLVFFPIAENEKQTQVPRFRRFILYYVGGLTSGMLFAAANLP